MDLNNSFLGEITEEQFLQQYWEKKPLLIKQAVPQASKLMTKELMIDMAYEEEVESRFLFQNKQQEWHLFHDPVTPELLEKHNGEAWTLINHGVNLFHKPIFELQKNCRFIPQWNFDDVMITYSMPDGHVGPHIDSYNVFIVQGHGTKRWQLNRQPDTAIYPEQELKILSNFNSTEEYILEEGDMLYIPPHVAHFGVSLTEGMSYSLGFNSLKPANFFESMYQNLQSHVEDDDFIQLPFKKSNDEFAFSPQIENNLINFWEKLATTENLTDILRQNLTKPRYWPEPNDHLQFDEFMDLLQTNPVYRHPYLRFNFHLSSVYINQEKYIIHSNKQRVELLTYLDSFSMEALPQIDTFYQDNYFILHILYLRGAIFFGTTD